MRHQAKFVAAAVCVLALSACSTNKKLDRIQDTQIIPPSQSFIFTPPGGPEIIGVLQSNYSNGVEQKIDLATRSSVSGQNYIDVKFVMASQLNATSSTAIQNGYTSTREIGNELLQTFPYINMSISSEFLQNNYGPFGYAIGVSGNGDHCLYGWQQIRSNINERTIFKNQGMVQIRLRLCDSVAKEKNLLSVLYGYTIASTFATHFWNPYGQAENVDSRLGASGVPIYPENGIETFSVSTAATTRSAPALPHERVLIPAPDEEKSATTKSTTKTSSKAPIVPLPPLSSVIQN